MSLMRPRNLLKLFGYCRGIAVNREKKLIGNEEIDKGVAAYSDDLLIEFSNELRDLCPPASDLLYRFIGEKAEYRHSELVKIIKSHGIPAAQASEVIDYMLYYGVFGVSDDSGQPTYIFNLGYDLKKLRVLASKSTSSRYMLHHALHSALGIRW
jgi:hypothetical protein